MAQLGGRESALSPDNPKPDSQAVDDFHTNDDVDGRKESHHHTLGPGAAQAAPGNHRHDGGDSEKLWDGDVISGSRGGNAAVASMIALLVQLGATDSTTP